MKSQEQAAFGDAAGTNIVLAAAQVAHRQRDRCRSGPTRSGALVGDIGDDPRLAGEHRRGLGLERLRVVVDVRRVDLVLERSRRSICEELGALRAVVVGGLLAGRRLLDELLAVLQQQDPELLGDAAALAAQPEADARTA